MSQSFQNKTLRDSRLFTFGPADVPVDQGVFLWRVGADPVARERFAIFKTRRRGRFGKKQAGFGMIAVTAAHDGSFAMESRWEYDAELRPRRIEVVLDEGAAPSTLPAGPQRRLSFSFKANGARLSLAGRGRPTLLNVAFKPDWVVTVEPCTFPFAVMAARYDRACGGRQTFACLSYVATDPHFTMSKLSAQVALVETVEAQDGEGEPLKVDHFVVDEAVMAHGEARDTAARRRIHVWCDHKQRLRKVMIVGERETVSMIREGDEALAKGWTAPHH